MSPRPLPFFWKAFYNLIAIPLMFVGFHAIAFFSQSGFPRFAKIRSGIVGRKRLFEELLAQIAPWKNSGPRFWIHASSMGEYEQARPLLQEIKKRFPEAVRVLTFFSPSAYTNVNRAHIPAEIVSYLPFDSIWNAQRFLNLVSPDAAIIIRHDFWPNHLWEAQRRGVSLLLANASVSANARSLRHWPLVRQFNRAVFDTFGVICAVSENAAKSLADLVRHPERLTITGDSRYDQVLFRSQAKKVEEVLPENWRDGSPIFVAGSTWPSDEDILLPAFVAVQKQLHSLRMILVPHEPTPEHLMHLEKKITAQKLPSVRLSQVAAESAREKVSGRENIAYSPISPSPSHLLTPSVLLVDRIGVLAILYSAGQVAFVGGSFGPGVHSVLEAAVHGVPLVVGPRFRNSPEALDLHEKKLLTSVTNVEECQKELLALFQNPKMRREKGAQHREFILARCGASVKIIDVIARCLRARLVSSMRS
jgi:3-deoxy-D-manno-octulosonic-acid transferase